MSTTDNDGTLPGHLRPPESAFGGVGREKLYKGGSSTIATTDASCRTSVSMTAPSLVTNFDRAYSKGDQKKWTQTVKVPMPLTLL